MERGDGITAHQKKVPLPRIPPRERDYRGPLSFFARHFNGDYDLGQSYWLNMLVIANFTPRALLAGLDAASPELSPRLASIVVLGAFAFACVAGMWGVIGTWRSANKHYARGGRQGWATAAKAFIILGLLKAAVDISQATPALQEHVRVASGHQLGPTITLQIRVDGKSILLRGGINEGAATELARALDLAPGIETVVFSSSGGWVAEGEKMAEVIRKRGLNTHVEQECSSACTIAFLGGRERSADPKARIGFHAFRSIGRTENSSRIHDEQRVWSVYTAAGVAPAFITAVAFTPPEKMWYPTHDEMLRARVLTRRSFGGETAAVATVVKSRATLAAGFREIALFEALHARFPAKFEEIVDAAWAMVQDRRTDAEVMMAGRNRLGEFAITLLPYADARTLLDFFAVVQEEALLLRKLDPEICVDFIFPGGKAVNISGLLPPDLVRRELEVMHRLIARSDGRNAVRIGQRDFDRAQAELSKRVSQRDLAIVAEGRASNVSSAQLCDSFIAYLGGINRIPEDERLVVLRALNQPRPTN